MLICAARGCLSNQDAKIDGNDLSFFPFPDDIAQRGQWLKNCQLDDITERDKPLYICKLHFEKISFTESMQLKPDAVPTIFDKEEEQRKRKPADVIDCDPSESPPLKQKKLDDESHSLVTPPQSPCSQQLKNMKEMNGEEKSNIPAENEISLNGSAVLKSELCQTVKIGKRQYRLTIQIDKIHGKPCPRSRKLMILAQLKKEKEELSKTMNNSEKKVEMSEKGTRKAVCVKGGCKLKKSVYDSKPAFQCEHCDKYYIMKRSDNNQGDRNVCNICNKSFPSLQSLTNHAKAHFLCDMCQTDCNSQTMYDKHTKLHVSSDPANPYKCHQCAAVFQSQEAVRQHYLIVHPMIKVRNTILQVTAPPPLTQHVPQPHDYRCISCNITFRNEQAYRNHISSHKKKEDLRCSITDTNNIFPVPNPLTGSQIGILRAVKFSCRVCSMEFDNVGEVDRHTRTHLEEDNEEEKKCNTCKKSFKTSAQLTEHLKSHEIRNHTCPICSKTFINRTTLKIHMKSHGET